MEQDYTPVKLTRGQEIKKFFIFVFFSASAGVIQVGVLNFLIFVGRTHVYVFTYLPALICSVLWNFTINRKFNFKSVSNIKIAMLKILLYYCAFTPLSAAWGQALSKIHVGMSQPLWMNIINFGTMIINMVTEFCVYRFWVYPHSINSSKAGQREQERVGQRLLEEQEAVAE